MAAVAVTGKMAAARPMGRILTVLAGASLIYGGWRRRSFLGALLVAGGGALLSQGLKGVQGSFPAPTAPARKRNLPGQAPPGIRSIRLSAQATSEAQATELYAFFRDVHNIPRLLPAVASISVIDARRSHWMSEPVHGARLGWDIVVQTDHPGEFFSWRSAADSRLQCEGSCLFDTPPGSSETIVHFAASFYVPAALAEPFEAAFSGTTPSLVQSRLEELSVELGAARKIDGQPGPI